MPAYSIYNEHPLFLEAHNGNLDAIKKRIANKISLSKIRASNGSGLLHFAAEGGQLETLKWLLSKEGGAKVTERNNEGASALLYAASRGHLKIVRWLLSEAGGAKLTEKSNDGHTALLAAAYKGQLNTVQYLLSKECAANLTEKTNKAATPLLLAAHKGQLETVNYFLTHPLMTYKHLKTSYETSPLVLKKDACTLIEASIAEYETLMIKSATDFPLTYDIQDNNVIVANELFCPISKDLITDPVLAADGYLYNKKHMTKWLKTHDTSPKTGKTLDHTQLSPARHIKKIIEELMSAVDTLSKQLEKQNALKEQATLEPYQANSRINTERTRPRSTPPAITFFTTRCADPTRQDPFHVSTRNAH